MITVYLCTSCIILNSGLFVGSDILNFHQHLGAALLDPLHLRSPIISLPFINLAYGLERYNIMLKPFLIYLWVIWKKAAANLLETVFIKQVYKGAKTPHLLIIRYYSQPCMFLRINSTVYFHVSYDLNIEVSREPALIWFSSQGRCPGQLWFGLVAWVGAQVVWLGLELGYLWLGLVNGRYLCS